MSGGLAARVVGAVIDRARHSARRVADRSRSTIPLPILARIDRNAIWIPAQPIGEVCCRGPAIEVSRDGQRCFECEVEGEVTSAVLAWADLVEWRVPDADAR